MAVGKHTTAWKTTPTNCECPETQQWLREGFCAAYSSLTFFFFAKTAAPTNGVSGGSPFCAGVPGYLDGYSNPFHDFLQQPRLPGYSEQLICFRASRFLSYFWTKNKVHLYSNAHLEGWVFPKDFFFIPEDALRHRLYHLIKTFSALLGFCINADFLLVETLDEAACETAHGPPAKSSCHLTCRHATEKSSRRSQNGGGGELPCFLPLGFLWKIRFSEEHVKEKTVFVSSPCL